MLCPACAPHASAHRVTYHCRPLGGRDRDKLANTLTRAQPPHLAPCTGDYARIVKDLASIGDTVDISTTKDAVKFSTSGDIGTANVTVR